jgi:hypothetical protein
VHVPTDTLVRYNSEWEGPLLGDKSWTALFDNSKVKRVAGKFSCAEDIDVILAEPIRYFKKRLADGAPEPHLLDALYDRICAEQSRLGT